LADDTSDVTVIDVLNYIVYFISIWNYEYLYLSSHDIIYNSLRFLWCNVYFFSHF